MEKTESIFDYEAPSDLSRAVCDKEYGGLKYKTINRFMYFFIAYTILTAWIFTVFLFTAQHSTETPTEEIYILNDALYFPDGVPVRNYAQIQGY